MSRIPLRNSPDRILSLPALLALVNGHVPLVLEVKSTWTRDGKFEANIAQMLAAYKGPAAVMSFDPYCLAAFREVAPELPRGLVADRFDDAEHWPRLKLWQRVAMRNLLSSAIARPNFIAYDIEALPALGAAHRAVSVRSPASDLDGADEPTTRARIALCRCHDLRRDRALV